MTIIDFAAKRQAAIEAQRASFAEYLAEDELRKNINAVCYEHQAQREREQAQRQKYEAAMLAKLSNAALSAKFEAAAAEISRREHIGLWNDEDWKA